MKMKQLLKKINKYALEASVAIAQKDALKDITEDDTDRLIETIGLLNDIFEELYDNVFVTLEDYDNKS